jgi:hypothetical protein
MRVEKLNKDNLLMATVEITLGSTSYRSVYKTVALYGEGHGTTEDFCY